MSFWQGLVGGFVILASAFGGFVVGLLMGVVGGRKKMTEWLEEKGCYTCQEKLRYREDSNGDLM